MGLEELTRLALQFSAIGVLIAMVATLVKALEVRANLVDKPGGLLINVIVGVVAAFAIAQLIAVVNTYFAFTVEEWEYMITLRLTQQLIVILVSIWAWRRLAKF